MSVLELIQAEEEKARQKKAAVLEENRAKLAKAQEEARTEADQIVAKARQQAAELVKEAQTRLQEQTREILAAAAGRDAEEAEKARQNLPQAAARIVERIEQQ
ncbi:MAG: hypothetical protein ACOX6P_05970 [Candidatus Merdivicinus sp.]|jgi:vacuolar-type H+-ATPase subunit H